MTDRELMQMAIDALEQPFPIGGFDNQAYVAKALRERLAQPEPVHASDMSQERVDETAKRKHEPVAWHEPGAYGNVITHKDWALANGWEPLYKEKNT